MADPSGHSCALGPDCTPDAVCMSGAWFLLALKPFAAVCSASSPNSVNHAQYLLVLGNVNFFLSSAERAVGVPHTVSFAPVS